MIKKQWGILAALVAVITSILFTTITFAANKGIYISSSKKTMYMDSTIKLKVSGTTKKIKWKSSNRNVATVDSKGNVHALKNGSTVISVSTAGEKYTCKCKVTVKAAKAEIKLNKTNRQVYLGNSFTLKATVNVKNGISNAVSWKSSNKKVATVDAKGKVRAVSAGVTTINVVCLANGKSTAKCRVIVKVDDSKITNAYTIPKDCFSIPLSDITSYSKLQKLIGSIKGNEGDAKYQYVYKILSSYDEKFFEKKQIYVTNYTHGSPELLEYASAERIPDKNGKYILNVVMTSHTGDDYTCEPYSNIVFIEYEKKAAKKVNKIEVSFDRNVDK